MRDLQSDAGISNLCTRHLLACKTNFLNRLKIVIISYDRPEMLKQLTNDLTGYDYHIIDDGSDFDLSYFDSNRITRQPHMGKKMFWVTFRKAINKLLKSKHDDFLLIPDDVMIYSIDRVIELHKRFKDKIYMVSPINDGRNCCWSLPDFKAEEHDDLIHTGFFDCTTITNRKTLSKLKPFYVPETWFDREGKSSGVGYNVTLQMNKMKVPMYKVKKSIVIHGDHESKMHQNERIKNKLISK